jgi:hypothetical protein
MCDISHTFVSPELDKHSRYCSHLNTYASTA